MPIYSFKCQMCNASVEVNVKITDDPVAGLCCGIVMQRDYTAPAIHFKGTGWGGDK